MPLIIAKPKNAVKNKKKKRLKNTFKLYVNPNTISKIIKNPYVDNNVCVKNIIENTIKIQPKIKSNVYHNGFTAIIFSYYL